MNFQKTTMDDFSRFKNGRSVSKYFGLTPTRHNSGEKAGRNGGISKTGDTTDATVYGAWYETVHQFVTPTT